MSAIRRIMYKFSGSVTALIFCGIAALIAPTSVHAQWWNPTAPDNYEDCVLEGMKGVASDTAAYAVAGACRQKFPVWCEVTWTGTKFEKQSKPLLGKYKTYTWTHKYGWKLIAYVPQSTVNELGARHMQFVENQKKEILKICR